jgi:hypothetical protein
MRRGGVSDREERKRGLEGHCVAARVKCRSYQGLIKFKYDVLQFARLRQSLALFMDICGSVWFDKPDCRVMSFLG